jgi:hypothetical protein
MGVTKSKLRKIRQDMLESNVLTYCYLKSFDESKDPVQQRMCRRSQFQLFAWKMMMRTGSSSELRAYLESRPVDPFVLRDAGIVTWSFDHPEEITGLGEHVLKRFPEKKV